MGCRTAQMICACMHQELWSSCAAVPQINEQEVDMG